MSKLIAHLIPNISSIPKYRLYNYIMIMKKLQDYGIEIWCIGSGFLGSRLWRLTLWPIQKKKDAILCRCVRTREEIARFFRAMPHRVSLGSSYETTQLREEFPEYGKFRKFMLSQGR